MSRSYKSGKCGWIAIWVCVCASGCSWDDSAYDTFMSNGNVIPCENMSAIQIGDCRCRPSGSEANCSPEASAKCGQFISEGAFEHSICPREFSQCLNGVCQLSPCGMNEHMGASGCEPDTERACGSADNDCLSRPGWAGAVCVNGACIATACSGATQLNEETGTCDLGECVDGFLHNGECVTSTVEQCGSNSNNCSITMPGWGAGDCVKNICVPSSCKLGYHLNASQDGCEGDTNEHCGAIGRSCVAGKVCTGGECKENCGSGEILCETDNVMTCADPATSTKYCGAQAGCQNFIECDTASGEVCVNGECKQYSCNSGTLCSTINGNTCIDLMADNADQCGSCNYKCSEHDIQNAHSEICLSGVCQYACSAGYINVGAGKSSDTIKCIDPLTDSGYCGATETDYLDKACGDGEVCVNGSCVHNSCTAPLTLCSTSHGNDCIDIHASDVTNCGTCNYKCSEHNIQNATSNDCVNGACQYACASGYVNVGTGNTSDAIKCIDPDTDWTYCGAKSQENKGRTCGSGQVCVDGECVQNSCSLGTLCSTVDGNQCIVVDGFLARDEKHCGACNYVCEDHKLSNATASGCSAGKCQYTCDSGYVNVGTGITADTILCINPDTNREHCGATGNANGAATTVAQKGQSCGEGMVCVDGGCEINRCTNIGETLCSTPGGNKCIDVEDTDPRNCGACNYVCSDHVLPNAKPKTGNACVDGKCQYTCDSGYVNVGTGITVDTIVCIDPTTSREHCGAEGNANGAATTDAQKGTHCGSGEVCVNRECVTNSCSSGTLCYVGQENQCIDINGTNASHCGACNYACSAHLLPNTSLVATNTCDSGKCQYQCNKVNNVQYVNVGGGNTADKIRCINPETDREFCGATANDYKNKACRTGEVCVGGKCVINSCTKDIETLCSTSNGNQCIDVAADDPDNCGSCGYVCKLHALSNAASTTCYKGACQYKCAEGFVNIGEGNTADVIVCVDPKTDNDHCGAKSASEPGKACLNGTICVKGKCELNSCATTNTMLCSVGGALECIDINGINANHCGACNYSCADYDIKENGTAIAKSSSCVAGECKYACQKVDNVQYVNVGTGDTADTINCINPTSDAAYCGATSSSSKGIDCNNNETLHSLKGNCRNSVCEITECAYGYHKVKGNDGKITCEINKDTACADRVSEDDGNAHIKNCTTLADKSICDANGECFIGLCIAHAHETENACVCDDNTVGNDEVCCSKVPNGDVVITENNTCDYTCKANFHKYDGTCEADDTANCGVHSAVCDATVIQNGETFSCPAGICTVDTCSSQYHLYDNGCELNNDEHCGSHGNKCEAGNPENSTESSCDTDLLQCVAKKCAQDYHVYQNACEADDRANCGEHEHDCQSNEICTAGTCEACGDNMHVYNNTCEANDAGNCGTHGNACDPVNHGMAVCKLGMCTFECDNGYHKYLGACEADNRANCGTHGHECQNNEICTSGSCEACGNNMHVYGNACEADDSVNCGAHGRKCNVEHATNSCVDGECTFTCDDGYTGNGTRCISDAVYCAKDSDERCNSIDDVGMMQICKDNEWVDNKECQDDYSCHAEGMKCGVCHNGKTQCSGRNAVQTCQNGAWGAAENCPMGQTCSGGVCKQ